MDYKAGIVHLSSSDGTLLEIPESKLSGNDLNYIRSQNICRRIQRKVAYLFRVPFRSEQASQDGMGLAAAHIGFSHYLIGPGDSANIKRPGIVRKLLTLMGLQQSK